MKVSPHHRDLINLFKTSISLTGNTQSSQILLLHPSAKLWANKVNKCRKFLWQFGLFLGLNNFSPHNCAFPGYVLCSLFLNKSCNIGKGNIWQIYQACCIGPLHHFLLLLCFCFSNVLTLDRKACLSSISR